MNLLQRETSGAASESESEWPDAYCPDCRETWWFEGDRERCPRCEGPLAKPRFAAPKAD